VTRRHEHLLAALAVACAVAAYVVGEQFYTFRLFFSWPDGGTWSNTIAWIEAILLAAFSTWYLRDHVGRSLAAWWNKHYGPHHQARLDAHHDRIVASVEERLDGRGPG